MVREGVTNTIRHSRATRCEISVRADEEQVRLTITDDGRGPASSGTTASPGLSWLRERVPGLGGDGGAGRETGGGYEAYGVPGRDGSPETGSGPHTDSGPETYGIPGTDDDTSGPASAGTTGDAGSPTLTGGTGPVGDTGPVGGSWPVGGTGLKGLAERLAAAGGTLHSGADGRRGFRVSAVLPVGTGDMADAEEWTR